METESTQEYQSAIAWSYHFTECAILCGGKGTRLGGLDKGSIPWKESTFLGHLTQVGRALTPKIMWVHPQEKIMSDHVLQSLECIQTPSSLGRSEQSELSPIRHIQDLIGVKGVLGAIGAALKAAERPWIWVLACDMPLVQPYHLLRLIERARSASDQTRCITYLDRDTRKVQPLCALWRSHQTSELIDAVSGRRGGLCGYARRYGEVVESPDQNHGETLSHDVMSPFFNVNNPEDLMRVSLVEKQKDQDDPKE